MIVRTNLGGKWHTYTRDDISIPRYIDIQQGNYIPWWWRCYSGGKAIMFKATDDYYDRNEGISRMQKQVKRYHNTVNEAKARLIKLDEEYKEAFVKVESYKGSDGYEKAKADLEKEYAERREQVLSDIRDDFTHIADSMRKSAQSRKLTAPTQEQVNLLNTLNMMDKLTESDVEQAKVALQDCPLAMKKLAEMAGTKGVSKYGRPILMESPAVMTNEEVEKHIQTLEHSADKLLNIEHFNSDTMRNSISHQGNGIMRSKNDYELFRLMCDSANEEDTMRTYGGVTAGNEYKAFCEAVDKSDNQLGQ